MAIVFSVVAPTYAADYTIKAGSTDVSVYVQLGAPSALATDVEVGYTRNRQARVTNALNDLATTTTGHTDWGIKEIANGIYRIDLPDAAVAAGFPNVVVDIIDASPFTTTLHIDLVGYDPTSANLPANVTQFGGQNGVFIAGRPEVTGSQFKTTVGTVTSQTNFTVVDSGPSPARFVAGDYVRIHHEEPMSSELLTVVRRITFIDMGAGVVNIDSAPGIFDVDPGDSIEFLYAPPSVGSINGTTFESIHLDHLFALADPGSVVTNNSFWAKLHSKSATPAYGDYNNTTDSLQAQRDNFDAVLDGAPTFSAAMDAHEYTSARAIKLDNLDLPVSGVRAQTPNLLVSTTISGTPSSQTTFVLVAGPPNDNALNGALVVVTNDANPASVKKAVGIVKDYVGTSRTVTLVTDPGIFTMASGDKVDIIAGGPVPLWLGAGP